MKIKILVGVGTGFDRNGAPLSPETIIYARQKIQGDLLAVCGGFTVREVFGGWRDETGKDWLEPGLEFTVVVESGKVNPEAMAAQVRNAFQQVYVVLEVSQIEQKLV